jgi:curli biogenesis system outer membrane secretion channel CsgG
MHGGADRIKNDFEEPKVNCLVGSRLLHAAFAVMIATLGLAAWPQASQDTSLRTTATGIAAAMERANLSSVTVLDLTDLQGRPTELGRFLAQELSDKMVGASPRVSVVDRTNLMYLLRENKLSIDGLINPETSRKLGKLIGVDTILVGSITPLSDGFRVNVRAVAVETGRVVTAQSISLPPSADLTVLSNRGVAPQGAGGAAQRAAQQAQAPLQMRLRSGAIKAAVTELAIHGGTQSTIAIQFENLSGEDLAMAIVPGSLMIGSCQARQQVRYSGLERMFSQTVDDVVRSEKHKLRDIGMGEKFVLSIEAEVTDKTCRSLDGQSTADVSLGLFVFDSKQGVRYPLLIPASMRHVR